MLDYEIVTVEPAAVTPASNSSHWFRYIIANGATTIEGMRAGTRDEVASYARQCAQRLNSRHKARLRW